MSKYPDGPAASFPAMVQPSAWYENMASAVVQDSVKYIHVDKRRFYWRTCFSILAICSLVGLTVAKYMSTSDLRAGVVISRQTNFAASLTDQKFQAKDCTCPCRDQQIEWSKFADISDDVTGLLGNNIASYIQAQCNTIVLNSSSDRPSQADIWSEGNATAASPSQNRVKVASDYVTKASQQFCILSLSLFFQQLNGNSAIQGKTVVSQQSGLDKFSSAALRTYPEIADAWDSYITTKLSGQKQIWLFSSYSQYQAPSAIAQYVNEQNCSDGNSSTACTQSRIQALDAWTQATAPSRNQSLNAIFPLLATNEINIAINANITGLQIDSTTNTTRSYDQTLAGLLRATMANSVTLSWSDYRDACNSSYCDVVQPKTPVFRATEFLSTVGGLWSTISVTIFVAWAICGMFNCQGKQQSTFETWH